MHSCFYKGHVRHRRFQPKSHSFSYKLFYVYLDLDELDEVFSKRWLWSSKKAAFAWFKRSDYLGDEKTPLKQAVYQRIIQATGKQPKGPVRILTHLRYFGFIFNPVSFYYCYDETDSHVEFIVAEITNTPWGQRHSYVLSTEKNQINQSRLKFSFNKDFHISPFMPMQMDYDWRFTPPADQLQVHMNNFTCSGKIFDATLTMGRQPINARSCAYFLTFYPLITSKVIMGIYWQALRLFLKRIPFFSHPVKTLSTNQRGAKQAK